MSTNCVFCLRFIFDKIYWLIYHFYANFAEEVMVTK